MKADLISKVTGRISRDLNRGAVWALKLTFDINLMAAFCLTYNSLIKDYEAEPQISVA
jgi:hypothetical protein